MQISENYELEHRRPFKFSGTAAALLLVSIFSGIFAWLIVNSELVSFLQLFLARAIFKAPPEWGAY
jgi:hypothetical protein